jgi:alpha-1,2-mannosyltransferase
MGTDEERQRVVADGLDPRRALNGGGLAARLGRDVECLGPLRFAVLFTLLLVSACWVAGGLGKTWWWKPPALVNSEDSPIGHDFVAPWSASSLALAGHPETPYDQEALRAAETRTIGVPVPFIAWFYLPSFLLLVLPLALLPYVAALALWLGVPLIALVRLLRRLLPHPLTPLAALIFPGTAQCLISGQNGIFSAALLAGGLLALETRPAAAGLLFGVLSYKPQLAAAVFAALLFGRHWRALAAALATALALAAASLAAFGWESWRVGLATLGTARQALETGQIAWDRLVTVFGAARLAGSDITTAYALQTLAALTAIATLWWIWRGPAPLALRGSALALAIPLTTPYAFDYDLVLLLLPLAWLLREGMASGFRRGEVTLLVLVWLCPAAGWLMALWSHLLVTPALLLLLLAATLRRVTAPEDHPIGLAPQVQA